MEKTLENVVNHMREQILEYALWRSSQVNTLDEFKETIKKEIQNMHQKNMKHIDKEINGKH